MRAIFLAWVAIAPPLVLGVSATVVGQAPPPLDSAGVNKQQIETALKLTREAAERYEITLDDVDHSTAKLLPDPILRWSNPAAGEIHGNVFVWTAAGRPAAVASIYKWFAPHTHMSHEFHSFALVPLRARYSGAEVWTTSAPGVKFVPLAEAPSPAASAPQRLLQMRQLAKDFFATKKDRDGSVSELRLLTQPIYRYQAASQQLLDGALFVFVQGTDPEVFLLLEARGPAGNEQWTFAAARMNSVAFTLRRHDKEMWSIDIMPWSDVSSHREVYTTVRQEQVQIP